MVSEIKNLNDVKAFAKSLVDEGTVFHPDDDFSMYVQKGTKEAAFSESEAQQRNALMEKCFEVCSNEGVDIYEFMLEVSLKESGMDSLFPLPSQSYQD